MPENTLAAFQNALEIGVSTLELDIAITADGVAVISHEPALNPDFTRDAQGNWPKGPGPLIKSLTLAQLQTFDVGRLNPNSEYARQFGQQQARDGQRIPTLASLFKLVRDSAWTAGMSWRDHTSTAHMVKASGGTTWSPNYNNVNAAKVKAAQQLGLKVIPWTVNDPSDMDRLIAWGVDGLISDYPDRAREAMRRAGLALPAALKP